MITEEAYPFHPPSTYRILYVGRDLTSLKLLQGALEECAVIRCPIGSVARLLIAGINYSLLLFDELLPDTTGQELADFTRQLSQRAQTPIIIEKSDDLELLTSTITRLHIKPLCRR